MSATETEPRRVVPAWRRMLVAAGWFALLLVAVTAAGYFYDRYRLVTQLERVMQELDEAGPGWRWPTPYGATRGSGGRELRPAHRRDLP
jgi:hypothetical protein